MKYWLIKSEPFKYSWDQFEKDQSTFWDGVRNYQARNNLREMKLGDLCLFYHSNEGKEVVGVAEVVKEWYQDPTTEDSNWCVVDVRPKIKLNRFISLSEIKADPELTDLGMLKQPRLSVVSISEAHFNHIIKLSNE